MKTQNRTSSLSKFSLLLILLALFSSHRAMAVFVYANKTAPRPYPDQFEQSGYKFGDEVNLSPAAGAFVTNFQFEYWGNSLSGDEMVNLAFYRNDGAAYGTNFNAPGTVIYQSGWSAPLGATAGATLIYDNASDGLSVWVPSNFTWVVQLPM